MATWPASEASDASPRKRKRSTNEYGDERIVKHRASKACRSCRHRKVRCDVAAKGTRCTNCELDDMECVVLPSRRGHSHRPRRESEQRSSPRRSSQITDILEVPVMSETHASRPLRPDGPTKVVDDPSNVPAVVTFDEDVDTGATASEDQPNNAQGGDWRTGSTDAYEVLLTPETRADIAPYQHSPFEKPILPAFIAPISSRTLPEDLDFLSRKGAFLLPDPKLRLEIMRAYLFSVHPFMPMLEVAPFLRALQTEDGQVSLLLFQSVMFAGLHSLPPEIVQRLGFQSPKQARQVFFNRARLLYDFNVEADSAAIFQSLILMSSWYSKYTPWNERRHTWHWTGLAYDLARSMGLHREPGGNKISPELRRFRRRLWWSLYIRDRLIALGTRRPMRIQDTEYDVELLTLDDFELGTPAQDSDLTAAGLSKEESTSTALMCIQLASLCVSIGRVVSSQYTTLGTSAGASHTMMVMPRRDGDHTLELQDCEKELETWLASLAGNVRRSESSSAYRNPHSCSEVHWAELNMTYLTAVNVLHRAAALRSQTEGGSSASPSKTKVKNAARSITRLGQDMLQHDQVRFLGLVGVTAFLAASLTHMLDAGSTDDDVRDASTFRLHQCLQVLQALRQVYASADSAFSFLASVTRKAGMRLPMLSSGASAAPASPGNAFAGRPSETASMSGQSIRKRPLSAVGNSSSHPTGGTQQQKAVPADFGHHGGVVPRSPSTHLQDRFTMAYSGPGTAQLPSQRWTGTGGFEYPEHSADHTMHSDPTATGNMLDWNNSFDITDGLGSLPFTYDFFSDAFGFLDGDMHGL